MASDLLMLGPIVFDSFSTPERMGFGGDQMLVVHRLPGGARVVDSLGPDDMDISWHGQLFGDGAYGQSLALDALRRAGNPLPLVFGGMAYQVIIKNFRADIVRFPQLVDYHISCLQLTNMLGSAVSAAIGGAQLAAADLAAAMAL